MHGDRHPYYSTHVLMANGARVDNQASSLRRRLKSWLPTRRYFICWMVAMIGCTYQVVNVSIQYLRYETSTETTITSELPVEPPSVNTCFELSDIIVKSKYDELVNGSQRDLDDLTIEELFAITPDGSEIARYCLVHDHDTYKTKRVNCERFEILKFFKQNMICFLVRLDTKPFEYSYITNGFSRPFVYSVGFHGQHFLKSPYYTFFMKSQYQDFYGNGDTYTTSSRQVNNESIASGIGNHIMLSYATYKSTLLPAPYTSKCIDYTALDFASRDHSYEACLIKKTLTNFNSTPFNVLTYTHHEHKRYTTLSKGDMRNNTIARFLQQVETVCKKEHSKPDCHHVYIVPKLVSAEQSDDPVIELQASTQPALITVLTAKMSFIDFTNFVLSCLGFWFGLCPLSLMLAGFSWSSRSEKTSRIMPQPLAEVAGLQQEICWLKIEWQRSKFRERDMDRKLTYLSNELKLTRTELGLNARSVQPQS